MLAGDMHVIGQLICAGRVRAGGTISGELHLSICQKRTRYIRELIFEEKGIGSSFLWSPEALLLVASFACG